MTSRRASSAKVATEDTDDFDFLGSQQSTNSDDHALKFAIAKHLSEAKEKQKKDKEKKFLQAARKQLSQDLTLASENIRGSVETAEAAFAGFLLQYAAVEDTIRGLWVQIRKEQLILSELAQRRHTVNIEAGKRAEEGHIAGLSRAKTACQDFREIIDQIRPQEK